MYLLLTSLIQDAVNRQES